MAIITALMQLLLSFSLLAANMEPTKTTFLNIVGLKHAPMTMRRATTSRKEYDAAIETLLGSNNDSSNASIVKAFEHVFADTVTIMQHNRRTTIHVSDVMQAAERLGYHLPDDTLETLNTRLIHDQEAFKTFVKQCMSTMFFADKDFTPNVLSILQLIFEALEQGTVTTSPVKQGKTLKLESPTGVTAAVFSRDWDEFLKDVEEENDNRPSIEDEDDASIEVESSDDEELVDEDDGEVEDE